MKNVPMPMKVPTLSDGFAGTTQRIKFVLCQLWGWHWNHLHKWF